MATIKVSDLPKKATLDSSDRIVGYSEGGGTSLLMAQSFIDIKTAAEASAKTAASKASEATSAANTITSKVNEANASANTAASKAREATAAASAAADSARVSAFAVRYSSAVLSASTTKSLTVLTPSSNAKVGDMVVDPEGSVFNINSVSSSTFTVGSRLTSLRGPEGKAGAGLKILGEYSSLYALKQAHPMGAAGDAYLVDGHTYFWGQEASTWIDGGKLQGPAGPVGPAGMSAVIAGATASIGELYGTPSVSVSIGGSDVSRTFDFRFSGLKGEPADTSKLILRQGDTGSITTYESVVTADTVSDASARSMSLAAGGSLMVLNGSSGKSWITVVALQGSATINLGSSWAWQGSSPTLAKGLVTLAWYGDFGVATFTKYGS